MRYSLPQNVKPLVPDGFPYIPHQRLLTRAELESVASSQREAEVARRADFLRRFEAFRATGDELRSFPTTLFSPQEQHDGVLMLSAPDYPDWDDYEPPAYASVPAGPVHQYEYQPASSVSDNCPPDDLNYYGIMTEEDCAPLAEPFHEEAKTEDKVDWSDAKVGVVSDFGMAPYMFKRDNSRTYMVKLAGKAIWGVDLERCVLEHNIKKGDKIAVKCIGKMPVTVSETVVGKNGSTQTVEKSAMRNTWVMKRLK